jgi:hypothetical protein
MDSDKSLLVRLETEPKQLQVRARAGPTARRAPRCATPPPPRATASSPSRLPADRLAGHGPGDVALPDARRVGHPLARRQDDCRARGRRAAGAWGGVAALRKGCLFWCRGGGARSPAGAARGAAALATYWPCTAAPSARRSTTWSCSRRSRRTRLGGAREEREWREAAARVCHCERRPRPTSAAQTPRAFPQTADDAIPVYWNWVSPTTIGIVTAVRARE